MNGRYIQGNMHSSGNRHRPIVQASAIGLEKGQANGYVHQ